LAQFRLGLVWDKHIFSLAWFGLARFELSRDQECPGSSPACRMAERVEPGSIALYLYQFA
jgi:hypothetical protein